MEEAHPPRPTPRRNALDRLRSWITWFGAARLVAAGTAVVLVAVAAFWLLRTPRPSTESQLPLAPGAATAHAVATTTALPGAPPATATSIASEIVVHVAGAVTAPGVYRLTPGARVVDAIAAAGGMRADADPDGVNLAAPARDGTRIYVPAIGEPVPVAAAAAGGGAGTGGGGAATGSSLVSGPIDLNAANAAELDLLPGVGPATAAAIVAYRDAHGPFGSVDDLAEVRGIGPAKVDSLRGLVTT